ncbi:phage major capsid protein [Dactylosporangium sp. NBC_01737]|uniref:phage major capsid protein n=1 Tax=Dactylosporangium sp. NBC_01737 TaxID=2975959 RepID=UPI002E0E0B05|nr:phage major capsid protein [Dactylosporangium sp. NBC_01737]
MDYLALADAVLEKRAALWEQRKVVIADVKLADAEKRAKVETIDAEMKAMAKEATDHIRAGEQEALEHRAAVLASTRGRKGASEWRSIVPSAHEWRALVAEGTPAAGGYAVPTKVSEQWIDKLRAQSTFLRAPGLNVIRYDYGKSFTIPQLTASTDPAVVGEGNAIPEGSLTFAGVSLDPVKYAALYRASSEIVEDSSVDIEDLIGQTLIRDVANIVDKDAFVGAGSTTALAGLTLAANSTAVNLATGNTSVKWDDVIDAVGAIMGTGGTPTVVWANVTEWKNLIKQREGSGATAGGYLAGSVTTDPSKAAMGLPLLPTINLPARTVIVADATRVWVGVRRDVRLARSEEWKFQEDSLGYRATYRIAGVRVAEATSIQKIVASAT